MSSFKIAAFVQPHCLSSAARVLHPTYHFHSDVCAGPPGIFSKIQILSLILHSVGGVLCGRIQFSALRKAAAGTECSPAAAYEYGFDPQ